MDVDDALLKKEEIWKSPRLRSVRPEARSIRSPIEGFTRDALLKHWTDVYDGFVARAQEADRRVVVSFHPSYFSSRRSELYSTLAVPIEQSSRLRFDHVVLLIDDIYDIQSRLGSKGDIFNLDRRLARHLLSQGLDSFLGGYEHLSKEQRLAWSRLRAENLNSVLSEIANWRRFDMVQAELLARAHTCRLTVLGVKHPFRSLVELLARPTQTQTAYLSHPISRPRRALLGRTVEEWPEVVFSSNRLGDRLAAMGIDLVMPTSIDEFRILPALDAMVDPFARPYGLGKRWPDLSPTGAIVENSSPAGLAFTPMPQVAQQLGTYSRALEKTIIGEVPFRDHFLVSNTDSFFVYRPVFGVTESKLMNERGGTFSGGVQAEIDHWVDSWSADDLVQRRRRALFVHSLADVAEVAWRWAGVAGQDKKERDLHRQGLSQALRTHMREQFGMKHQDIEAVLSGSDLRVEMLDDAIIDSSVELKQLLTETYENAGRQYLIQYLSGGVERHDVLESGDVAIYLTSNEELSDHELQQCADYLKGADGWEEVLIDPNAVLSRGLNVDSLGEWVVSLLPRA